MEERTGEPMAFLADIHAAKTGHSKVLPILSGSMSQVGRGIIPDPRHLDDEAGHNRYSFYPEHEYTTYRWTMVIDLERCIGCGACVAACYMENNVPITGKKEHLKGRELSWLRIEPYYDCGDRACFLPMLCQHCNKAPCEPVCPVYATYHNPEGLNAQVYNRCVGTRYCSNNCPYKVRRFNWFDPRWKEPLTRMLNPDISVRGRGIMEKCTFCVQRIRAARDTAKDENRLIRDGEVIPACAQTCPTRAVRFGNILDETSEVYQLTHAHETFHVHEHLGTEPSVYYLKRNGMKHGV
jgi:molybdopterin-containing oxidoreductase family iron-sulfur binding subunit